jgi:2-hydroxychromene-2-carboxylate isomerase
MARNNLRKAALLGLRLKPPAFHPFNPLLPLRASSLELEPAERSALITRLFEGTWSDQLATSEPEVVARLAEEAGISDPAGLVQRATIPEAKQRLRTQTDEAIARGLFGVPIFEVEGELFWGYDDLPYLELFLAGEDPLDPEEARLWGVGPPRPSAMRRRFREEAPPSWQREAEKSRR